MNFLKKHCDIFVSAGITAFVLAFIFNSFSLFPFGEKTLSWGDLSQQNLPVLLQLKDVLAGASGPFFSMANAGGMDFFSVFLFLASSPFSLLTVFVEKTDMINFVNIIIALKIITCSVTACFFFRYYFKRLDTLTRAALSLSYAFCGYSMMYYQLITWLDVMYMFPLLLIAFGYMLKKNRIVPYIFCLSAMIFFQFYLGYMLALFIIFGFSAYILFSVEKKLRKKQIITFCAATFTAVLITAPVWLSAFSQFLCSARSVSVLSSLKSSGMFTDFPTTLPMILSSGMIIVGMKMLLSQKLVGNKKLFPIMLMLILLMIPIFIEPINKMWHTGSYQAFPARYGFMLVLTGLTVFACSLEKIEPASACSTKKDRLFIAICTVAVSVYYFFTIFHIKHSRDKLSAFVSSLWGSPASLVIILSAALVFFSAAVLITKYCKNGFIKRSAFSLLLCVLVIGECCFNASIYMGFAARTTEKYTAAIDLSDKISDNKVFRVKTESKLFDVNLVGAMGYNSLAHYTSLVCERYLFAMKKLGYSSYWMEVGSNGSTPLTDALMGNKYTISTAPFFSENNNIIYQNKKYAIYENINCLSLATLISAEQALRLENITDTDRINFQQLLFSAVTNSDEILLTRYEPTAISDGEISHAGDTCFYYRDENMIGNITYNIEVSGHQRLYFDCFKYITAHLTEPINSSFDVFVNGNKIISSYPTKSENGFLFLGDFEDESVTVTLNIKKSSSAYSFGVFGLNMELLDKELANVRQADLSIDGDTINISAYSESGNDYLMLMIPNNKGFEAIVNGNSAEIVNILDTFMAIKLYTGENTVVLSFSPQGFKLSMVLFVVGLAAALAFSVLLGRRAFKYSEKSERIVTGVFLTGAGLVFLLIYVFPLAVWLSGLSQR